MVSVNVHCPHGQSAQVYCHGQNPKGFNGFRCRDYLRVFHYEARKTGVKEQIVEMAFNGSGIRNTTRVLKIGINTVIKTLKNSRHAGTSSSVAHGDVALICELKQQGPAIWYAYNTKNNCVLAYTFGPQPDETYRELLVLLSQFSIRMITSYAREVPKDKHL